MKSGCKMSIAAKQQEKAGYDLKSYRANFLPKISGMGMFPLLTDDMFGSLAVTIMAGLLVGTVITLVFIPVLYALFFKEK